MLVRNLYCVPLAGTAIDDARFVTLEAEIKYARDVLVDNVWTARLTLLYNTSFVRRLFVTMRTVTACDAQYMAPENVCVCAAMNEVVLLHETALPSHPPVQGTTTITTC
jgi:hypothetical protein